VGRSIWIIGRRLMASIRIHVLVSG
jgi:hypothetical protein